MTGTRSVRVDVGGLGLHGLEAGEDRGDPPVLLIHGWPTSSALWRNVMPAIARQRRVLAIDLPGFGRSDKPIDASYSFRYYARAIDGFLAGLGVDRVGLVVHDLGGPVGLYWAAQQPEGRVERLALLNTIVYSELSLAAKTFLAAFHVPGLRTLMCRPVTLRTAFWFGIADRSRLQPEALEAVLAPFADPASREALMRTCANFDPAAFGEIAAWVRALSIPVRVIYGRRDWLLPDIATTVARIAQDLPGAEVTELPDAGHFVQEERPEELGAMLATFFSATREGGRADAVSGIP